MMTKEQIEKLEAGKDLDALIAEQFFFWEWWRSSATGRRCLFAPGVIPRSEEEWFLERADMTEGLVCDWATTKIPAYSTDMSTALPLLEALSEKYYITINTTCDKGQYDLLMKDRVSFASLAIFVFTRLPLAICRAALMTSFLE